MIREFLRHELDRVDPGRLLLIALATASLSSAFLEWFIGAFPYWAIIMFAGVTIGVLVPISTHRRTRRH